MIIGCLLGGVLGSQMGLGSRRTAATIVGRSMPSRSAEDCPCPEKRVHLRSDHVGQSRLAQSIHGDANPHLRRQHRPVPRVHGSLCGGGQKRNRLWSGLSAGRWQLESQELTRRVCTWLWQQLTSECRPSRGISFPSTRPCRGWSLRGRGRIA